MPKLLEHETPEASMCFNLGLLSSEAPLTKTSTAPNNPFPAKRASDRSQVLSTYSMEWQLQKIETAARAQHAQI
eukprot:6813560-Alexandrium_andersonii.AAC.1